MSVALCKRSALEVLVAGSVGLLLILYGAKVDIFARRSGLLPVPSQLLFCLLAALLVLSLYVWLRSADRFTQALRVVRSNRPIILMFCAYALVSLVWSLMPGAFWHDDAVHILFPSFDLVVFLIGGLLPLWKPFRRHWRVLITIVFALVAMSNLSDALSLSDSQFSKTAARSAGFARNPNSGAYTILMLCAMLLNYRRISLYDLIVLTITAFCIFFSLSRGGIICFVILSTFYVSSLQITLDFRNLAVIGVAIGLLFAATVYSLPHIISNVDMFQTPVAQSRLETLAFNGPIDNSDPSIQVRQNLIIEFVGEIKKAPLLGHGTAFARSGPVGPHNMYLMMWVDLGIIGVALYLGLLIAGYVKFSCRGFLPGKGFILVIAFMGLFNHGVLNDRTFLMLFGIGLTVSWFWARGARDVRRAVASGGRPASGRRPSRSHRVQGRSRSLIEGGERSRYGDWRARRWPRRTSQPEASR